MTQTIAGIPVAGQYISRGNLAAWDWHSTDLTTDGTWRNLDLSSIIPAGVKLVHFRCAIKDGITGVEFALRTNGYSNDKDAVNGRIIITNIDHEYSWWVEPDDDRLIEYRAANTTWTLIDILVRGWIT